MRFRFEHHRDRDTVTIYINHLCSGVVFDVSGHHPTYRLDGLFDEPSVVALFEAFNEFKARGMK